ncbi:FadR/GntR family transcriptional regulator [Marinococcus sp. PL1-022]|uniref:FadR/GntR family transcriptional regulator n=1 Tax=Marinococcus sp. PL1-022 TaxID=3095363 RepID=UPI0029C29139|nr:FCD domain-containing protein [Marinococcus sp. PL1-022]MDX6151535.1 FCD domain-containing protein [Marinococcus sp. PL1-022]
MIEEELLRLIEKGTMLPGDKLPAERMLADRLRCSRTSLREAFRVLESKGIIVSRIGGGRYLQNVYQQQYFNYDPVKAMEQTAILHFIEARKTLEPNIARLASERATLEQLEEIEKNMKSIQIDTDADKSFHLSVAEASGNFVFVTMMKSNLEMIYKMRSKMLEDKERYKQAQREHEEIFRHIKNRQGKNAEKAMLNHLQHLKINISEN